MCVIPYLEGQRETSTEVTGAVPGSQPAQKRHSQDSCERNTQPTSTRGRPGWPSRETNESSTAPQDRSARRHCALLIFACQEETTGQIKCSERIIKAVPS
ncbi:hypothetical protein PVAP13_4KG347888 [Panicum virgatum]|uniref:Uncharacterized protein n=1 Tax=Panicum virgatum TaxID=38727 RepID=A0A8T0TMR0_PANVG|nr:hypothetical protein PVAP13_4KG347888 [Panicum virgatum]